MKRRVAGQTLARLGSASGISVETLKRLEAGRGSISWSDLVRIADVLGCEVSELFDGLGDA
jgi:transcriptional regulator with XRE-family HTH domain